MACIKLKPWDERDITAQEFIQQANGVAFGIRDAQIFVMNLPTVNGLGQFGGFDMYLQDRSGQGRDALAQAMGALLGKASRDPTLTGVRPNTLADAPQLRLAADRTPAQAMGLSVTDIYNAISLMLAPVYVNAFTDGGRVQRVPIPAPREFPPGHDSQYRFYPPAPTPPAPSPGRPP